MLLCPNCKSADVFEREFIDSEFDGNGSVSMHINYSCYDCGSRFEARVTLDMVDAEIIEVEENEDE